MPISRMPHNNGDIIWQKTISIKNVVVWNVCICVCENLVFLHLSLWWAMYDLLGIELLTFILTHII